MPKYLMSNYLYIQDLKLDTRLNNFLSHIVKDLLHVIVFVKFV